jgi:hypothetical protein
MLQGFGKNLIMQFVAMRQLGQLSHTLNGSNYSFTRQPEASFGRWGIPRVIELGKKYGLGFPPPPKE